MLEGANMLKRAGVPFSAYFMTGFPGETDDDVRQTIDFAKQVEADYYSLSVLAPYYGTELYDQLIKNGNALDKQPWEYFFHQSHYYYQYQNNSLLTKCQKKQKRI